MQVGAIVAGVVSAIALVFSLVFLARQTRESAYQSRLANQIAGSQAKSEIYGAVDRIQYHFLAYPTLRKYFYDGAELPVDPGDADQRALRERVLTFAELFVDALERGLDTYRTVDPAADFQSPMDRYTQDIWSTSPAVRYLVRAHPGWWPNVESWIDTATTE
jgi:hypothetical protein